MTTIQQFALPSLHLGEDSISLLRATWECDIAKHADLLDECAALARRQTVLMERIRLGQTQTEPDCSAFEYPASIDFLAGESDVDQLSALDTRMTALSIRMRRLEGSILTYEPETEEEAAILLRFLSATLASQHKIDADYLAEVLDRCAVCVDPVWSAPVVSALPETLLH